MLKIAIVEDEESCAEQLKRYLQRFEREHGETLDCICFSNGMDFVSDYTPIYDVIFMDIEMPHLDGMTAAKKLRGMGDTSCLIFVTNMSQFALNGYEVEALDYIVKPVSYFTFSVKFERAVEIAKKKKKKELFFLRKDGAKKIYIDDILYVEVYKHHIIYHTQEEEIEMRGTMKDTLRQLQGMDFVLCNKAYLINLRYVSQVKQNMVYVLNEPLIISRNRKKEFLEALTKYYGAGRR